jgi:hypothetical protein
MWVRWGDSIRLFGRVLEPVERLSEILFGLIMALTVTSAVSVATADDIQIRTMLIAALGCNLAWGIIDVSGEHPGLTRRDWQGTFGVLSSLSRQRFRSSSVRGD